MKRYWKLAVLVPVIVLGIGMYYTQAAGVYPEFELKTLSGDGKLAADLTLQGMYRNEEMTVGQDGSEFLSERGFWNSMVQPYLYNSSRYERLLQEYPGFLRGKSRPAGFYEHDAVLGYADIQMKSRPAGGHEDFRFALSVYDKGTRHTSDRHVPVPDEGLYYGIFIDSVRFDGGVLRVLTTNFRKGPGIPPAYRNPELHQYSLDPGADRVTEDRLLLPAGMGDSRDLLVIGGSDPLQTGRYTVFRLTYYLPGNGDPRFPPSSLDRREIYVYDAETDRLEIVQSASFDDLLRIPNDPGIFPEEDRLYFVSRHPTTHVLRVVHYGLADHKVTKDYSIPIDETLTINNTVIANQRLYLIMKSRTDELSGPELAIADLNDGTMLYRGTVVRQDHEPPYDLRIHNVLVKEGGP
ncbi:MULTISPECIES: hypothetical protein [Paenibacillus]|uniref:hypothetical protein n=1 Tax=Paenibacillus TaxID=44249 RepID=UPI0022B8CD51|nr:hypothetical protein [Paenibacillus caseinilyticus]MCZ8520434.1 hypothetical protein [Paenibacillus caseinilyticus]